MDQELLTIGFLSNSFENKISETRTIVDGKFENSSLPIEWNSASGITAVKLVPIPDLGFTQATGRRPGLSIAY